MSNDSRTWSRENGVWCSSDGYWLRSLTPAEYTKLTNGRCTATGVRRVWVVVHRDGNAILDYPSVVSGHSIEKAKEALKRYEWRMFAKANGLIEGRA
jgi:hypothetical protein